MRSIKMDQDKIFKQFEGDNYFRRNQKALNSKKILKNDIVLKLLRLFGVMPRNVLELGCANGYRLNYLKTVIKAKCSGVDCSKLAIASGRRSFKGVNLICSGLEKFDFEDTSFDLVIVNFVFHWADRSLLPAIIREIDRVLKDKGLVIIGDFYPLFPVRKKYHHLKDDKIYTYKEEYGERFKRLGHYQNIGRLTGACKTKRICTDAEYDQRIVTDLLIKDLALKKKYDE